MRKKQVRKVALIGLAAAAGIALLSLGLATTPIDFSTAPPEEASDIIGDGAAPPSDLAPVAIPRPKPLGTFASRAALLAPDAAVTDVSGKAGKRSAVRLTTRGATVYTIAPKEALATPVDIRRGFVILPFRPISYVEHALRWSLQFHSAGTPASPTGNYHEMDAARDGPSALRSVLTSQAKNAAPGRWQNFGVSANDLYKVGTGADLAHISFVRLIVRGGAEPMVIELGNPYFQPSALDKAKAMISFDDGYASVVTNAMPLFEAKGFRGMYNLGALQNTLGTPGHLDLSQLKQLRKAGWQWMQQAYSTEEIAPYVLMTPAQRDADMRKQVQFAKDNDLGDSGFGSYFSQVNQAQLDVFPMFARNQRATRAYFTARGVDAPDYPILYGENYPFIDPYLVKSLAGDVPTANFARLTQHAEQAIATNGVAIYTFHNTLDNLPALLDWLDQNRDRIDVVTEADLNAASRKPK